MCTGSETCGGALSGSVATNFSQSAKCGVCVCASKPRPALVGLEKVEGVGRRLVLAEQVGEREGLCCESAALVCLDALEELVAALSADLEAHVEAVAAMRCLVGHYYRI